MKVEQRLFTEKEGWSLLSDSDLGAKAQLVFVFGDSALLKREEILRQAQGFYPNACLFGCSTAGEIMDAGVRDGSLAVTAVFFESTKLNFTRIGLEHSEDSFEAGSKLVQSLPKDGLRHVFILSDGLNVNGSALVRGISGKLPHGVAVTGGLSGDQDRFKETFVIAGGESRSNVVGAIGFYGERMKIAYASVGGWDAFGPERSVTRAEGNVLYELDDKPALDLYKMYLGEQAKGLPATGLLFPLSLRLQGKDNCLVRTILGINEDDKSMVFAGEIPQGSSVRLMKTNFERLIQGACEAASLSFDSMPQSKVGLAILISCVGRKLILKQRADEEIEGVKRILGEEAAMTGFYSYGEICPYFPSQKQCELHNQTMTITIFSED